MGAKPRDRREYNRKLRQREAAERAPLSPHHPDEYKSSSAIKDFPARLAEIPFDSRSEAQKLLGDPIPARSALALKGKG